MLMLGILLILLGLLIQVLLLPLLPLLLALSLLAISLLLLLSPASGSRNGRDAPGTGTYAGSGDSTHKGAEGASTGASTRSNATSAPIEF